MHAHNHFTALLDFVRDYLGEPAVASAGPYAKLHLDPDTTMPASHHSVFYRLDALPAAQPTASKH